jgi:ribonuclease HI
LQLFSIRKLLDYPLSIVYSTYPLENSYAIRENAGIFKFNSIFMTIDYPIEAIYTDGSGNLDTCGYAAVMRFADGRTIDLGGYEQNSTNHRAELLALIVALDYLHNHPQLTPVSIFSDSQYAVDGLNEHWVVKWQQRNWLNSKGKPVINRDLWEQLEMLRSVPATFHHLRGHTDALGKKGRDAIAKNLARFGADTELHNQGNLAADKAADRFRLGLVTPTHQLSQRDINPQPVRLL